MEPRPSISEAIPIVTDLLKRRGASQVYLFGSAAAGNATEASDLDFAVVGLPPERFYKALGEAMCLVNRNIDLIDLEREGHFGRFLRDHGRLRRVA